MDCTPSRSVVWNVSHLGIPSVFCKGNRECLLEEAEQQPDAGYSAASLSGYSSKGDAG